MRSVVARAMLIVVVVTGVGVAAPSISSASPVPPSSATTASVAQPASHAPGRQMSTDCTCDWWW